MLRLTHRPLFPPAVSLALLLALLLVFTAAPWPPLLKMRAVGFGLDPQRPAHSFFLDGEMMPIEARKVGIYGGFALAVLWLAWRAPRAAALARVDGYVAALLGITVMGLDGTNALLYDLGAPHLYAPRLDLRLGTGLLCGLGMAALLWPIWAQTVWRIPQGVVNGGHFVVPLLLSALLLVGLTTGQGWLMLPVSLLGTFGLVAVVALMNGVGLLVLLRREAVADHAVDVLDVAALSAWLAVLELLALAAARYLLIGTAPLP